MPFLPLSATRGYYPFILAAYFPSQMSDLLLLDIGSIPSPLKDFLVDIDADEVHRVR